MATKEQALNLDPAVGLRFKGPFKDVVTADLKLTNPTEKRICFKVKTTAPKRYCVRPNSGILEPKASVSVAVMLQPFEYDSTEKPKHKFMVQSMFAPDHPVESQELLWKDAPPESLMDTKLKCFFVEPDTPASSDSKADTSSHYVETSVEEPVVARADANKLENSMDEFYGKARADTQSPKKTGPLSGDEMRKIQHELRKAQTELGSLKTENTQLRDEGVRLRKVAMTDTVRSTPINASATSVVPSSSAFPPVVYVVLAILLGLIVGKFVL